VSERVVGEGHLGVPCTVDGSTWKQESHEGSFATQHYREVVVHMGWDFDDDGSSFLVNCLPVRVVHQPGVMALPDGRAL
jgi:hypothetical protein